MRGQSSAFSFAHRDSLLRFLLLFAVTTPALIQIQLGGERTGAMTIVNSPGTEMKRDIAGATLMAADLSAAVTRLINRARLLSGIIAFAEAEGRRGRMTRTWFALPDDEVFAVAGIWRDTAERGPANSMVMAEACHHVQAVHDRMPAILQRETCSDWLDGARPMALGCFASPIPPR